MSAVILVSAVILKDEVNPNYKIPTNQKPSHSFFDNLQLYFFIKRPIFATVIAILMVFGGLICLHTLPVSQYPDITPPTVMVSANYPARIQFLTVPLVQPVLDMVRGTLHPVYRQNAKAQRSGDARVPGLDRRGFLGIPEMAHKLPAAGRYGTLHDQHTTAPPERRWNVPGRWWTRWRRRYSRRCRR